MAVIQSTYPQTIPQGYPGQIANGETSNRLSRTLEDAVPALFGSAIFQGAGDHGCTATPAAGKLVGFAITNVGAVNTTFAGTNNPDGYSPNASVGILTLGVMWVMAAVAVAKGDQAYVTSAGALTNVAGANIILPGWYFDNAIAAAGLTRIARR